MKKKDGQKNPNTAPTRDKKESSLAPKAHSLGHRVLDYNHPKTQKN
jgi:hypothetical protein